MPVASRAGENFQIMHFFLKVCTRQNLPSYADVAQNVRFRAVDAWLQKFRQWAGSWPDQAAGWFSGSWGLDPFFSVRVAALYLALYALGLKPRITSGFRSPTKQAAMRAAWDRGDRAGLRVRPADPRNSLHCRGTDARPAALAVDMPCDDDRLAAQVATAMGLRAGLYFPTSDPGHYDDGGGLA